MAGLKEKLEKEISDEDFSPAKAPALEKVVNSLKQNPEKCKALLKSFPGVLLLGDWGGKEINREFFESVKKELTDVHHCNVFMLSDVKRELEKLGETIGDVTIRIRGIDEAAVVLLVDGDGAGTAAETTHICQKENWNSKCIPFVKGNDNETVRIFTKKDYLRFLKNSPVYYNNKEELRGKLVSQSIMAVERWITKELNLEGQLAKNTEQ